MNIAYFGIALGFGFIYFMLNFSNYPIDKIWTKARSSSIHLSIFFVTIFALTTNIFFGKEINNSIVWTGTKKMENIDVQKADLLLTYLTQIVPPLESSQYYQNAGFLTEGTNFFDKPSLPNTIISGLARENITTYTVAEGDTYWTIAYKFELDIDTLLWANNIAVADVNNPVLGKELIILPTSGLYYVTTEGDTVQGVSDAFKVSVDKIKQQNKLTSNTLTAGQKLVIPGAKKEQPKPIETIPQTPSQVAVVPSAPQGTGSMSAVPNYAGDRNYYSGTVAKGTGQFLWPVNTSSRYVSQYFGWVTQYYKHTGIDLDWRNGLDIIASDAGTVVAASYGWGGGYGNHIIIDHGNGYQTLYGHLASIGVKVGQKVNRGQSVGVMGTTGISTGVHLHFEIRQNGVAINPSIYIK